MPSAAHVLRGRPGWVAVTALALVLAGVVAVQARPNAAHADPAAVTSTSELSLSVATPLVASAAPESDTATATTPPKPAKNDKKARPARKAPRQAGPAADVCSGPRWQEKRGQRALSTLKDTGQRSGVTVSFKPAKSGYLGLTYPSRRHVDVFVRSCSSESASLLRHVVSHEMGHAYDAAHMTPALRDAYKKMRGIPAGTPWFGCSYCTDFSTPAGDFAETYSQWQRGSADSRTKIAPMPSAGRLAAIAAAFFQG
jgi:hypothetical protein